MSDVLYQINVRAHGPGKPAEGTIVAIGSAGLEQLRRVLERPDLLAIELRRTETQCMVYAKWVGGSPVLTYGFSIELEHADTAQALVDLATGKAPPAPDAY